MTPKELFNLIPVKHGSLYDIIKHIPEIDKFDLKVDEIDGIVIAFYACHTYDGERVFYLGSVSIDNQPFMIFQNAGRGGQDHHERFITNQQLYNQAVEKIKSFCDVTKNYDLVNENDEIPNLTSFYSDDLTNYYDPNLEIKRKMGDIVKVKSLGNYYNKYKPCIVKVTIEKINKFNPTITYGGKIDDSSCWEWFNESRIME